MRSIIKIIIVSILILMLAACAGSPIQIPDKYLLDGQLQRVDEIADLRAGRPRPAFSDFLETFEDPLTVIARRDTVTLDETENEWIKVDDQSFIIRAVKNEYYLLVLDRPAINLMTTNTITFQLLANALRAKADYINLDNTWYSIERIYKIKNRDELYFITNKILTQL